MQTEPVLPVVATLPDLDYRLPDMSLNRSEIEIVDSNPFSFYVHYDPIKWRKIDEMVQSFGKRTLKQDHVDEPKRWALVFIDDHWYRAEVLEKYCNRDGECCKAEVCLIDFGRKEIVSIENIYPIGAELLNCAAAQSLRVFPKISKQFMTGRLYVLFNEYPEMRIQLSFRDSEMNCVRNRPHIVGVFAEIRLGYEDWISVESLLQRFSEEDSDFGGELRDGENLRENLLHDHGDSSSVQNRDKHIPGSNEGASFVQRLEISANTSRPVSGRNENTLSKQQSQAKEMFQDASDDDITASTTVARVDERVSSIRYEVPRTAPPVDIKDGNQGASITERTMAKANLVAKRNEKKINICDRFRIYGTCPRGQHCHMLHQVSEERSFRPITATTDFQDYTDQSFPVGMFGFAVCTHVSSDGTIFLVLPYGPSTIWGIIESGPTTIDLLEIKEELSKNYEARRGQIRCLKQAEEFMAVAWLDDSEESLFEISKGWYRVKILQRVAQKCEIYLVDHGATCWTLMDNIYPLESSLKSYPRQAIRCLLQQTVMVGSAKKMLSFLKNRILIFKVYEQLPEDGRLVVELIDFSDGDLIHCGEKLEQNDVVTFSDI